MILMTATPAAGPTDALEIGLVLAVWCRLTGHDPQEFDTEERAAFRARPQVAELAATPYPVLLDGGITAARRGSLPLERWLAAVRDLSLTAGLPPAGSSR